MMKYSAIDRKNDTERTMPGQYNFLDHRKSGIDIQCKNE